MAIKFDTTKFFQISLIAFIVIEALTWLLSQFDIGVTFLKGGWIIFMFLLVILLVTLWQFGTNLTSLKIKDFIFMILVLGVLVILYILLPQIIPQIFSVIPGNEIGYQLRDFFTKTLGSILKVGTGVV